jgi:hypothetical protein
LYSYKELRDSEFSSVKDIYFEWLRWRFNRSTTWEFLSKIEVLSDLIKTNCKGMKDAIGNGIGLFFNTVEIIKPIIDGVMKRSWDMFKEVNTENGLIKTILDDEAFWIEGEEFLEVKYLVRNNPRELSKSQIRVRKAKWKERTRRRMKGRKKKNRLKISPLNSRVAVDGFGVSVIVEKAREGLLIGCYNGLLKHPGKGLQIYVREDKPPDIPQLLVKRLAKVEYGKTACEVWKSFRGTLNGGKFLSSGYLERSRLFSWKKVLEVLVLVTFEMLSWCGCRSKHRVDFRDLWQEQNVPVSQSVYEAVSHSVE